MQLLQVFLDYNCRHVKASDTECLNLVPYRMKWLWWRNWSRISSKTESWHLRKCQSRDCWSAGQASCRHQGEGARSGFCYPLLTMSPFLLSKASQSSVSPAGGSKNVRWFKSAYLNYIWFVQGKGMSAALAQITVQRCKLSAVMMAADAEA